MKCDNCGQEIGFTSCHYGDFTLCSNACYKEYEQKCKTGKADKHKKYQKDHCEYCGSTTNRIDGWLNDKATCCDCWDSVYNNMGSSNSNKNKNNNNNNNGNTFLNGFLNFGTVNNVTIKKKNWWD